MKTLWMHAIACGRALLLVRLLALVAAVSLPAAAYAHGGEDHGDTPATVVGQAKTSPRVSAQSELYELVGTLKGQVLTIYLDRFADNIPVSDAKLVVSIAGRDTPASLGSDGTYSVQSPAFMGTGSVDLMFNVTGPAGDDLLIGTLRLGQKPTVAAPGAGEGTALAKVRAWVAQCRSPLLAVLVALIIGVCLGAMTRHRRWLPMAATVGLLTVLAFTSVALAHEGHDDASSAAVTASDAPQRLPDSSVELPKPSQRILEVRTALAKPTTAQKAVSWVGRVIIDPNRSGLVQSINGGRVLAPESGLPHLGQAVRKGDVLALVEGPIITADRATISEKLGDIEQQTALAEAKLARARRLFEQNAGTHVAVTDAELEVAGLKRRAEIVRGIRAGPEALRAPIDGVVATARVVAGQVVQAQDVLFQIVDPKTLWVEALVYGDTSPTTISRATAATADGLTMNLAFQGMSRTLQQQATVVQFAVVNPPSSLSIGQPVTVLTPAGAPETGIILPRDAVVKGSNGDTLVWRHVEPERFEPRPVRAEAFDATRLVIRAGLKDGERIVVRGAELINQVR